MTSSSRMFSSFRTSLEGALRRPTRILRRTVRTDPPTAPVRRRSRFGGGGGSRQQQYGHNNTTTTTTTLDVARFGLLSIATLPFSLWVAFFSYDYYYRIQLCRDALAREDDEIAYLRAKTTHSGGAENDDRPCIGRDRQLAEARNLLANAPHQIVVVAGTNESGKSHFVSELLRGVPVSRGVTYIQLAPIVDSLSTLTHALVRAFDLRWLKMRHSLVDVLPFAGSEILVMKERFSDRDLAQALLVVTEALKAKAAAEDPQNSSSQTPVIVIDGLGEGSAWIRSPEGRASLQRLIKWCIFITKERQLAHVVLTGNEELVISLTDQNRMTRGHVKVIGLTDLSLEEAGKIVLQDLPDASEAEVQKITNIFGGFIHDVQAVSREIQHYLANTTTTEEEDKVVSREKIFNDVTSARFRLQVERVTAAFAKGRDEDEDAEGGFADYEEDDMDPFLDPLKATYSEAAAIQKSREGEQEAPEDAPSELACWSKLQLWHTLEKLVESDNMTVPFADLRDDIYDGNMTPLLELMNEDVLGFEVDSSSESGWSWQVKPATPALGRVFQHLVNNSHLKERFQEMQHVKQNKNKLQEIEQERRQLRRERQRLDMRKASLLNTVQVGKELKVGRDKRLQRSLESVYFSIAAEEVAIEKRGLELRNQYKEIVKAASEGAGEKSRGRGEQSEVSNSSSHDHLSIRRQLKHALYQTYVKEASKDKFGRFRHAFELLASSEGGGVTADDVVRLIKMTSGEDVNLKAAEAFIRAWDTDRDTRLDYDEFVRMLLTDPKLARGDTTRS